MKLSRTNRRLLSRRTDTSVFSLWEAAVPNICAAKMLPCHIYHLTSFVTKKKKKIWFTVEPTNTPRIRNCNLGWYEGMRSYPRRFPALLVLTGAQQSPAGTGRAVKFQLERRRVPVSVQDHLGGGEGGGRSEWWWEVEVVFHKDHPGPGPGLFWPVERRAAGRRSPGAAWCTSRHPSRAEPSSCLQSSAAFSAIRKSLNQSFLLFFLSLAPFGGQTHPLASELKAALNCSARRVSVGFTGFLRPSSFCSVAPVGPEQKKRSVRKESQRTRGTDFC